ncbi:MAG: prepilin-type N-terminal cleavage/methylation domain-containing protein [Cytophagaceae bacterium]
MKNIQLKKLAAFTLTEVLVVLVIVGILVLLALPNLMPLISKAKSTEAKIQLEHVYTLQKTFFYERSKYTTDLETIGFIQEKLVSEHENGNANYRIEIVEAGPTTFTARATAVVDFDGDGTYNIWEIDHEKNLREVTPD